MLRTGMATDITFAIIGTGFAGLGAAIALRRAGPSQPELRAYLRDIAARYGLRPDIRFGHDVTAARWDDPAQRWQVTTSQGEFRARYLIAATGALAEPRRPAIPGLDRFAGRSCTRPGGTRPGRRPGSGSR
jgi:cation diffusion facilitator CzcD-associated flavoprotein CzcO